MGRGVTTQVSLDLTTTAEALEMARGARRAGIDWLEAGTPLILGEGLHAVAALREEFPGIPIVADLKTMDGAGLEAEMMLGAGATHVVVMSRAHPASVEVMVEAAHARGGQVMADVLAAEDDPTPQSADLSTELSEISVEMLPDDLFGTDHLHDAQGEVPLYPKVRKTVLRE